MTDVPLALTFDDVLIVPRRSGVRSRRDVDTAGRLTRRLTLKVPVLSANMDTVTEWRLAAAMAREGGIGIIHRFMTIDQEVAEIARVKRPEEYVLREVFTARPDQTIADASELLERYNTGSLLVVDASQKVLGILTTRDLLFEDDGSRRVADVMTPRTELVTAPVGTTIDEARRILHQHRLKKLPLVDNEGRLQGLITARNILRYASQPSAAVDDGGRLLVGAAIGAVGDYLERAAALVKGGVDVLVVDIAHGHSEHAIKATRKVKDAFPDVELIAGNVATAEGTQDLIDAGADAIKVGVGPGAACTTRLVAGVGVPQLSAIMECAQVADRQGIPIVADGGIKFAGDITKAIVAGASTVMIGNLLAGTEESPGSTVTRGGGRYKVYRGMASTAAAVERQRLDQPEADLDELAAGVVPEGVEAVVPYKGTLSDVLFQLVGGLRSGMSYCNARTLRELRENARFVRVSEAGWREGMPRAATEHA
ncbi:MAG TPA: IMP dehydrogenase [Chloroflexota bacterium]|jgi:IMP dehydrogenase|nr:IMP dehydrogenase [Chloroflexota bacterium]